MGQERACFQPELQQYFVRNMNKHGRRKYFLGHDMKCQNTLKSSMYGCRYSGNATGDKWPIRRHTENKQEGNIAEKTWGGKSKHKKAILLEVCIR